MFTISTGSLAGGIIGTAGVVYDGDTLAICTDGNTCTKIRLCGIDTPERGHAGWRRAREVLASTIHGQVIRCVPVGKGSVCDGRSRRKTRDRIVAQCFIGPNDDDISVPLLRARLACDWVKFSGGHYGRTLPGARACPPD